MSASTSVLDQVSFSCSTSAGKGEPARSPISAIGVGIDLFNLSNTVKRLVPVSGKVSRSRSSRLVRKYLSIEATVPVLTRGNVKKSSSFAAVAIEVNCCQSSNEIFHFFQMAATRVTQNQPS